MRDNGVNALVQLRQQLPHLTKSARAIGQAILDDPRLIIDSTITELAANCDTSATSVARFCSQVGYEGYTDLRLAIAAAHSRDEAARDLFRIDDAEISGDDDTAALIAKVAFQEARAIEETARALDAGTIDAVAEAMLRAGRIELFGVAASGLTALDLQLKLTRFGRPASSWQDVHLAITSTALLREGDVALVVSHTGATREALELIELANSRGATTVTITNAPDSPVGRAAHLVLATAARESKYRTGAMSSRLAQMAVVDVLVLRMLQHDFSRVSELLRDTFDAVSGHRVTR